MENFRVAWLSLDEADNDVARFAAYLVEALRKADVELEKAIPDPMQLLAVNPKTILDSALNAVARLAFPLLLVAGRLPPARIRRR